MGFNQLRMEPCAHHTPTTPSVSRREINGGTCPAVAPLDTLWHFLHNTTYLPVHTLIVHAPVSRPLGCGSINMKTFVRTGFLLCLAAMSMAATAQQTTKSTLPRCAVSHAHFLYTNGLRKKTNPLLTAPRSKFASKTPLRQRLALQQTEHVFAQTKSSKTA
jgi:hypothetical protein